MAVWCDFHVHSDVSDGAFPPVDVVDLVADQGVRVLALTYHDSTAGHAAARRRADERGVSFVGGIEMTAYAGGRIVHVLGLGVSEGHASMERANASAMRVWEANQRRWLRALEREGQDVSESEVLAGAPLRLPVLIERLCRRGVDDGDPRRCHERFKRFFGALDDDAYRELPSPAEAAAVIRETGGIAVLAHPARLNDDRLAESLAADLDGIEALYAPYEPRDRDRLLALANRLGKLHSCGSDFHGHFEATYENPRFEAPRALLERLGVPL